MWYPRGMPVEQRITRAWLVGVGLRPAPMRDQTSNRLITSSLAADGQSPWSAHQGGLARFGKDASVAVPAAVQRARLQVHFDLSVRVCRRLLCLLRPARQSQSSVRVRH